MINSFNDSPATDILSPKVAPHATSAPSHQLFTLSWLDPTPDQLQKLPQAAVTHAGAATWGKLLLLELLPATLGGWVLYLDADVLVAPGTRLADIWDEVVAGSKQQAQPHQAPLLAAVRDFGLPCGHQQLKEYGWPWVTPAGDTGDPSDEEVPPAAAPKYFNAGVLLLDLAALRKVQPQLQGLVKAQVQRVATGGEALHHADQDLLNLLCWHHGGFLELSYKWNVQGVGSYLMDRTIPTRWERPALYSRGEAATLEQHPAILHFTGTSAPKPSEVLNPWVKVPAKPWSMYCTHPYRPMWESHLDRTFWQGHRPNQAPLVEAAVGELQHLSAVLADHVATRGLPWDKGSFLTQITHQLTQTQTQEELRGATQQTGNATGNTSSSSSSTGSQFMAVGTGGVHPVFAGYSPPADISSSLGGLPLDPHAGFHFTVDWFDPHVPNWRQYIVPQLLPEGVGSKPLRCLEVGCWEGRSTCYILLQLAAHPGSALVCVDPFDQLYPQFKANREAWLRNVAAAGGLGDAAAADVVSCLGCPAEDVERRVISTLYAAATEGTRKVRLLQQASTTGLAGLLALSTAPAAGAAAGAAAGEPLFDFMYIDGSHMRGDVLTDAVLSWQLLRVGGVMVFDDYEWDRYRDNMVCHPKEAVDAFLGVFRHQLQLLHKGYQVMVLKTASG